jgi:fatty-acid desaturase
MVVNKEKHFLFIFQLLAHASLIWAFFNFGISEWLIVFGIYFLTGCLGVSITYHRLLSHSAFIPRTGWQKLGTLFAFWGIIGSSIAWVNNHKTHHRYADKEKDPHSPSVLGRFRVQYLSMYSSATSLKYVISLIKDPFHVFLHRNYFLLHLSILLILLTLFGWYTTSLVYLVPAAVLWNAGSLINTVGHTKLLSYRNYETNDSSQNNFLLGYLVWGEGWHNNHHKKAAICNFGHKWWEFDLSNFIIKHFLSYSQR